MKRAFIVAAALGLALPGLSLAQQPPEQRERAAPAARPEAAPAPHPAPPPAPRPQAAPRPPDARPALEARPAAQPPGHPFEAQPVRPQPSRPQVAQPHQQPRVQHPGPRPVPAAAQPLPPRGNQFWHRGQYYGRVHGPAYSYPRGYAYRRWSIGVRLPPVLVAPSYYYQDWSTLGLESPPPGYAWVRFGPDLLLVNIDSHEVEDVVYGVFQ